jgi:hypothetical protein
MAMSLSRLASFLAPALLGLLLAPAARAEQADDHDLLEAPRHRQGYYLSVGSAGGAAQNWEDGDAIGVAPGYKIAVRAGQLVTRRLGLGVAFETGGTRKGQIDSSLFGLGLEGSVALTNALALRAFLGFGALQIDNKGDEKKELKGAYGAQYGLGLSYDFFPFQHKPYKSGGWALTPTLEVRGLPEDSGSNVSVFFGFEVAWWTGLPRHQLELPESEAYKK